MNIKFLIPFAFVLVSIFSFTQNFPAQKLISGGKPKRIEFANFGESYCVNLTNKFSVCKIRNPDDESLGKFIIQNDGKILGETDAPVNPVGSGGDSFFAYRGDLDKDGSSEIVIASLETVGNGMGIAYYNVHIFRDPIKFGFQTPLTFPIEDFGEKGNFIYEPKRNETQILVTYWQYRDDIDLKRGNGMYLHGSWFRYRDGLLEPVFDKPTLARRFLYSFGSEVKNSENNTFLPYLYLKSRNTHKLKINPRPTEKITSVQNGVIENYKEKTHQFGSFEKRNVFVRLDSGELIEGVFYDTRLLGETYTEKSKKRIIISDFGFFRQRFLVPFDFSPLLVNKNLVGKKVRIEEFNRFDRNFAQLWFLEK